MARANACHCCQATQRQPACARRSAACTLLALHVISVSFIGWYFLFLLNKDRKANKGSGLRFWQTPDASAAMLHFRTGIWLLVGGLSQAAPYFATFGTGYFGQLLVSESRQIIACCSRVSPSRPPKL